MSKQHPQTQEDPSQYTRLQALHRALECDSSRHDQQFTSAPPRNKHAIVADAHEPAGCDDGPWDIARSSVNSPSQSTNRLDRIGAQMSALPFLNELSERVEALETVVEEQRQWNEDIERTTKQLRQSLLARGGQNTRRTESSGS
ncbi:hypothetical protein Asppvi_002007 [Aspergillus pseudoviridinutans]|uniref:Uncharacterized protein n=1 Tax=Aspergillus pseudoviridinutans TaxID=1517512 RepID=A0A9P3BRK3_9EURO|nr:uncharacterized protein Asppvi_002007 [Aspergillus pseudoviridinutans]GIJ92729.1 hypothetical protein Asppvi_002007 [Aspergillus pseudoviridinutans]